jgi:heme/copper-type cytochrome/quinol oxidase subunit 2
MGGPPPNYLVWAILTTVLCCPPLGIPSIVFSTRVNSKWAVGDIAGAHEASARAKTFAIWSTIAGIISGVLLAILFFVFLSAAVRTGSTVNNTAPGY